MKHGTQCVSRVLCAVCSNSLSFSSDRCSSNAFIRFPVAATGESAAPIAIVSVS